MKRIVFLKKTSLLIFSGLISSCGFPKGNKRSLSKSQIKDIILSEFVRETKMKHDSGLLDPKQFGWDKHLGKELGLDSLDTVEFVMQLEKRFNISIKDADAEKITTPNQAVDMVYLYLQTGVMPHNK